MMKKFIAIIGIVVILTPSISLAIAQEFSTNALYSDANVISYWKLEDATDDISTNDLTNTNLVTFLLAGQFGNDALFVKASSQDLGIASDLGITGGSMSMTAWVKVSAEPGVGAVNTIWYHADVGTHTEEYLFYRNNGGTLTLDCTRTRRNVADDSFTYAVTLGTTDWHHLAYTYNTDTNELKCYLDGTEVAGGTSSGDGSSGADADAFHIGTWNRPTAGGKQAFWNGEIDDVTIFNRELTAAEVSSIYDTPVAATTANNMRTIWIEE